MKTRKQKVISIFVSVFLLASFCLFPLVVSAAGYSTYTFDVPNYTDDVNMEFFRFAKVVDTLNTSTWEGLRDPDYIFDVVTTDSTIIGRGYDWTWPDGYGNSGVCTFYVGHSTFNVESYNTYDTIWIDSFKLQLYLHMAYSGTTAFRINLREIDTSGNKGMMEAVGKSVGRSEWITLRSSTVTPGAVYDFEFPDTKLHILTPGTYDGLAVCIDVQCSSMESQMGLGFLDSFLSINYAQGGDPNVPSYTPPSGNNELNDLGSSEDALLDSSSSGVSTGLDKITSALNSVQFFGTALTIASSIITKFMNLSFINVLLNISLGMGLCGSLLGLAGAIISASDRRASAAARAQRNAERAANNAAWSKYRSLQSKYYNSKISYYRSRSKK